MNPIVLQFANGSVFFYGICLAVIASFLRMSLKSRWTRSVLCIVAIVGAVLVILSATPQPVWIYCLWLVVLVATHITLSVDTTRRDRAKYRYMWFGLFAVLSILMCILEIPYHLRPTIPSSSGHRMYVIGDSLSMGADAQELNWPELLAKKTGLPLTRFAHGGATVSSARDYTKRINDDNAIVILQIGGNDVLNGTDVRKFQSNLDLLLANLCRADRLVVMLELPLPPFHNRYGKAQRKLAKQYGVTLIPKRYMTRVLGAPDATLDGLHLSHAGHAIMADIVAGLISRDE